MLLLSPLTACKKAGACTTAADHITDLATGGDQAGDKGKDDEAAKKLIPEMKATLTTRCRDDKWSDMFVSCTSAASTRTELSACMKGPSKLSPDQADKMTKAMAVVLEAAAPGGFRKHLDLAKASEATLLLGKIGNRAKAHFRETAQFPKGNAVTLPATPCCSQPDHKCAVSTAWGTDPVWKELDITVDEPTRFQYSYQSDGQTFTATAVGDFDCDGNPKTFTMNGSSSNGSARAELVDPQ